MMLAAEAEASRRAEVALRLERFALFPAMVGAISGLLFLMSGLMFERFGEWFFGRGGLWLLLPVWGFGIFIGAVTYVAVIRLWWRWAIRQGVDLHRLEESVEQGVIICRPNTFPGRLQRRWLMPLPAGYPDEPKHHTISASS